MDRLKKEVSYRRGLDGKMVAKWIDSSQNRHRRWIPQEESIFMEQESAQLVNDFLTDYQAREINLDQEIPPLALAHLETAVNYPSHQRQDDLLAYQKIYKPVGILPPDQYFSVVLQATEGCSFNSCTFCDFYSNRPFRIKPLMEFKEHCGEVFNFLGAGLSLRRTIFLGDANALVIPMGRLVPMIQSIHEVYNVEQLGGIYSFLDGFSGDKKSKEDYALLANLGFKRIYIGMESGNDELLQFIHKPGTIKDMVSAVRTIKAGGVSVGIIVLAGAGGQKFYKKHVRDTIAAINAMQLDAEDILYFSELVGGEDLQYTRDAFQHQLGTLNPEQIAEQIEEIERKLVFKDNQDTPHISRYDIREFVY